MKTDKVRKNSKLNNNEQTCLKVFSRRIWPNKTNNNPEGHSL